MTSNRPEPYFAAAEMGVAMQPDYMIRYTLDAADEVLFVGAAEMGVTMQPDYMIRYAFDQSAGDISTDAENIYIGFSTQEKHGQIMFIRSDGDKPEYISIEINNNGLFLSEGWALNLNHFVEPKDNDTQMFWG